jgi:hypothetical protein
VWELSQFPTDWSILQYDLVQALVQCGCDGGVAGSLAERALNELRGMVAKAGAERDRRLSHLPASADLRWSELRKTESQRSHIEAWTDGHFAAGTDSIAVRLTYHVC